MTAAGELLNLPQNPIPAQANVVLVDTIDGATLRAAYWRPGGTRCPGTVCLLHGRAEFIEKHFEVIGELLKRGFAVVTFDWRGQGRSSRETANPRKGHIDDFSTYHLDVAAIAGEILKPLMPQPYFGLAFSMGGAIALDMAAAQKLPFQRVVAVAPMLKIGFIKRQRLATFTAKLLYTLGLSKAFVPFGSETSVSTRPFPGNRLSSDPIRYARSARTAEAMGPGAIGAPTVGWTRAAFAAIDRLARKETLHTIHTPLLLVAAGCDTVCDPHAIELAASHLKSGAAIRIPDSRHEILQETDTVRETFWAAFDAFIPGGRER